MGNEFEAKHPKTISEIERSTPQRETGITHHPLKFMVKDISYVQSGKIHLFQWKRKASVEEDRKENKGVMLWQKRLGLCKRNNERTKEYI